ncbi:unnamed protein product [Tilletia controversa]|nr:unnamed protein product [Tilletia controversa]
MNPSEQDYTEDKRGVKRQRNLGSGKNAINKRPQRHTAQPQRFVPAEVQRVYPGEVAKHGKDIYKFHNEEYRNGFCEKAVSVTSLVVEDVQPTLQEIELFQGVTAEVNVSESVNLRQLAQLKRKANEVVVQPGDHVEVFEGEQRGVRGTVDAINGQIIIISMEHDEMDGTKVEVQLDQVRKTFKPGDHVKVGFGDHTDETGMVLKVEGETTTFLSDLTVKEVAVFSKNLREAAEVGSGLATVAGFNVHDLVMCNHRAAVIFNIERVGFRILDEEGNTHLVPPRSLLLLKNAFSICIDHEGHEIRKGDTMKETEGDSPRNGKVIQPYQSGVVFLFSRDISENNGVWYASPSRLTPLTPHHIGTSVKDSLDKMNPARNMQLMASRGNDPTPTPHVALSGRTKDYLKGRHVVVVKGPFKSYRGIIKETLADDKAYVELHTTNRNETFPLALLKEKDPDTGQSKPLAIGGGPGANSGPAQGKSNMRTLYSSGSNGIMGPPMGGGTPCGGMAPETGRTPPMGFAGASTPMGAGHCNDGKKTPFQAPSGVKSFAGPGQRLGGPTPRSAAAVYGARTPKWSATGKKTPAMTKSTASFVG